MPVVISTTGELDEGLRRHLLSGTAEQVAFLLAEARLDADRCELRLVDLQEIPHQDFEAQTAFHLALKDEARARVIKWAWDQDLCLVEAHSHRFGPARFSPTDITGLEEFVPHVWWRLRGRPYAALVLTEGDFDAVAWICGPHQPERVESLTVDGRTPATPTGLSHELMARRGIDG